MAVMPIGNVLVSKISRRCDVPVFALIDASEVYDESLDLDDGKDCVMVFAISLSTVWFVK